MNLTILNSMGELIELRMREQYRREWEAYPVATVSVAERIERVRASFIQTIDKIKAGRGAAALHMVRA